METSDWASIVYVRTQSDKVVLVLDPKKPYPQYWKFPGGGKKRYETSDQTATRELEEETGLVVDAHDLFPIGHVIKKNHTLFLFYATVRDLKKLKDYGNEGEWIATFDAKNLLYMEDLLPDHRQFLPHIKTHEAERSQHACFTKDVSIALRPW